MSEPKKLLVRPMPFANEAWQGYLLRLAGANCLQGVRHLARIFDKVYRDFVKDPYGSGLSHIQPILSIHLSDFPCQAPPIRHRYCPMCLQESPYIRANWEWPLSLYCQRHDAALISRCPSCLKLLTYSRMNLLQCDCGLDLICAQQKASIILSNCFSDFFIQDTSEVAEFFPAVPREHREALAILNQLLPEGRPALDVFHINFSYSSEPAEKLLQSLVQNLDVKLKEIILDRLRGVDRNKFIQIARSLRKPTLLRWNRFLQCCVPSVPGLVDLPGSLVKNSLSGQARTTINSLCSKLEVPHGCVMKWIESAGVVVHTVSSGLVRVRAISNEDAERLLNSIKGTVSLREVCQLLGLNKNQVSSLARSNFLPFVRLGDGHFGMRFQRKAIEKNMLRLYNLCQDACDISDNMCFVEFRNIYGFGGGTVGSFRACRLLNSALKKNIKIFYPSDGSRQLGSIRLLRQGKRYV